MLFRSLPLSKLDTPSHCPAKLRTNSDAFGSAIMRFTSARSTAGSRSLFCAASQCAVRDAINANIGDVSRGLEPFHHDEPDPLEAPSIRPWGDVEFEMRDPDGYIWAFVQG